MSLWRLLRLSHPRRRTNNPRSRAPRSGAGNLARGTRFLRTPGKNMRVNVRTPDGVRGILDTPFGVRSFASDKLQAYAKNAYAWLMSQHASGVRGNWLLQLSVQERPRAIARIRRDNVPVADELVFINHQTFHSHRTTRVCLVRADPNLCTESIAEAIGKPGRGIPEHTSRIHLVQETPRPFTILSNDGVRVRRTVLVNVIDRLVQAVHDLHIHNQIEIFRAES